MTSNGGNVFVSSQGLGFGDQAGNLLLGGTIHPTSSWSDTAVVASFDPSNTLNDMLAVRKKDHWGYAAWDMATQAPFAWDRDESEYSNLSVGCQGGCLATGIGISTVVIQVRLMERVISTVAQLPGVTVHGSAAMGHPQQAMSSLTGSTRVHCLFPFG